MCVHDFDFNLRPSGVSSIAAARLPHCPMGLPWGCQWSHITLISTQALCTKMLINHLYNVLFVHSTKAEFDMNACSNVSSGQITSAHFALHSGQRMAGFINWTKMTNFYAGVQYHTLNTWNKRFKSKWSARFLMFLNKVS